MKNDTFINPIHSWHNRTVASEDGTELWVEHRGSGTVLFLCDGIMCDGHVWKYLNPHFRNKMIVHWHYPGHGRSTSPGLFADLSPSRLARDMVTICTTLNIDRTVIVAHSFGVQVALETARLYPSMISGLVLVCGAPGKMVETFNNSRAMKLLLPLFGLGTRFLPRQATRLWKSMPTRTMKQLARQSDQINERLVELEDLDPYFEGLAKTDIHCAIRMLEAAEKQDMEPFLTSIEVPTLIIAGKRDRFTPINRSRLMADLLPDAAFFPIETGTHSLPLEQPDLVNLGIERFLENEIQRR